MSWFEQQYEREPCDRWCPLGACQTCAFRGGDSSAAQQDSARETGQEMGADVTIEAQLKRPLAVTRGLTAKTVRSPDGCL
jgi:hypothetical protein